ncbi:MAG: hypothetical protein P4M15_12285 [Alphaproteobacteria bacterium]|nr:hypothetical protein [Alphaproteobacteria bacterium]
MSALNRASTHPEMGLLEAYDASVQEKARTADAQLQKAIAIYDAQKSGQPDKYLGKFSTISAGGVHKVALRQFVAAIDAAIAEKGIDRAADPAAFAKAVKNAYRDVINAHGIERVDPAAPGGVAKYEAWFKIYNKSFPIPGERESKEDMRELLEERMTKDGYGEIAIGLRDPLTGVYIGGVQALVVAKAASGMFTYAFIDSAFQGLGLAHTLLDGTRKAVSEAVAKYNPKDTRPPMIFLEKNKLSLMPLENIYLDTTGIDVAKMPHQGSKLPYGAKPQSERDLIWSTLGAKEVANAGYIQPSLDGVTQVKDPAQRDLAIRYLREDRTLSETQRQEAAGIINTALEGKAAHCPLALCSFVGSGTTQADYSQVTDFLRAFLQKSCLDTNKKGLENDIFAQATLGKLAQ